MLRQLFKATGITLISNIVICAIVVIFVMVTLFQSYYTLKPHQNAVLETFGVPRTIKTSGLHFKVPWVQKVYITDKSVKGFSIGYLENGDTNDYESFMITKDMSFVNTDFYLEYQVVDPQMYRYNSDEPVVILHSLALSCIRDIVGLRNIDEVITTGKAEIVYELKMRLAKAVEESDLGLALVNIRMQDAYPPVEVEEAFKNVENARQQKEELVYNARKYENEKLPAAEADADKTLRDAEAIENNRKNEAIEQLAIFEGKFSEYSRYPELTRKRMFWETMERVLPNQEIIFVDGDGNTVNMLPIDSFN